MNNSVVPVVSMLLMGLAGPGRRDHCVACCHLQANSHLDAERTKVQRLRSEAQRTKAQLLKALDSSSALAQANVALNSKVRARECNMV